VTGDPGSDPARHFGRQVRKARQSKGWSLAEFGERIAYDKAHVSRVENGWRAPTEAFARACDRVFPERGGWFTDFWAESRTWLATPPWFRPWAPHELNARTLRDWYPGIVTGLLQSESYAAEILSTAPGATDDMVAERLSARMARQRVLTRDSPPVAWFLVDVVALCREIGSADVMAGQLRHLGAMARLPHVTVQLVPATGHAGFAGGFVVADSAAYAESVVAGHVYEDEETVSGLVRRFDTIRGEALRVRDSLRLIEWIGEQWSRTGGPPPIQQITAASA
jgi:hypothetical protein